MSFIASGLYFRLLNSSGVYDKYMLNTNILILIVSLLNMYIIVPDIVSIHFVYSYYFLRLNSIYQTLKLIYSVCDQCPSVPVLSSHYILEE